MVVLKTSNRALLAAAIFSIVSLFVAESQARSIGGTFSAPEFREMFVGRNDFSTSFTQERKIAILSKPLLSKGTLDFSIARGLRWQITSPIEHTLLMHSNRIVQYGRNCVEKPMQSGAWQAEFIRIFSALVRADLEALTPHFDIDIDGNSSEWTSSLVPVQSDLKRALGHVVLYGDNSHINRVELRQGQDITTMLFSSPTTTPADKDLKVFECK